MKNMYLKPCKNMTSGNASFFIWDDDKYVCNILKADQLLGSFEPFFYFTSGYLNSLFECVLPIKCNGNKLICERRRFTS